MHGVCAFTSTTAFRRTRIAGRRFCAEQCAAARRRRWSRIGSNLAPGHARQPRGRRAQGALRRAARSGRRRHRAGASRRRSGRDRAVAAAARCRPARPGGDAALSARHAGAVASAARSHARTRSPATRATARHRVDRRREQRGYPSPAQLAAPRDRAAPGRALSRLSRDACARGGTPGRSERAARRAGRPRMRDGAIARRRASIAPGSARCRRPARAICCAGSCAVKACARHRRRGSPTCCGSSPRRAPMRARASRHDGAEIGCHRGLVVVHAPSPATRSSATGTAKPKCRFPAERWLFEPAQGSGMAAAIAGATSGHAALPRRAASVCSWRPIGRGAQ